jgi:hypothetical protein
MNAVPFDTLKLSERLAAGGFTPEQARAAASALVEALASADLVTREYLDSRLRDLEQRLIIRLGGMLIVAVGVILAAMRYLPPTPHP